MALEAASRDSITLSMTLLNKLQNVLDKQIALTHSWELAQLTGPQDGVYSLEIVHNLGFHPNVTIKTSGGDILETGIDYNSLNKITLIMAQPFSGTAYLS